MRYFLHSHFTFRRNNDILRRYNSLSSMERYDYFVENTCFLHWSGNLKAESDTKCFDFVSGKRARAHSFVSLAARVYFIQVGK